jgi:3-deoxy-D-manno-octulosonate 8-phosphate phosphatase (KDO 8-P phosphatase)
MDSMVRAGQKQLSRVQLVRRARNLRLVLTDNDGVLTDTGVYYGETGEVLKRFSIRDGMGVEILRQNGIETAIITSESSPSVRRRAEKLRMQYLYLGIRNKAEHLPVVLSETGLEPEQLGYIGDDVNDIGIIMLLRAEGLTAAPSDAMPSVLRRVHYQCKAPGGNGAFRDFAEWILRLRGTTPGIQQTTRR